MRPWSANSVLHERTRSLTHRIRVHYDNDCLHNFKRISKSYNRGGGIKIFRYIFPRFSGKILLKLSVVDRGVRRQRLLKLAYDRVARIAYGRDRERPPHLLYYYSVMSINVWLSHTTTMCEVRKMMWKTVWLMITKRERAINNSNLKPSPVLRVDNCKHCKNMLWGRTTNFP